MWSLTNCLLILRPCSVEIFAVYYIYNFGSIEVNEVKPVMQTVNY